MIIFEVDKTYYGNSKTFLEISILLILYFGKYVISYSPCSLHACASHSQYEGRTIDNTLTAYYNGPVGAATWNFTLSAMGPECESQLSKYRKTNLCKLALVWDFENLTISPILYHTSGDQHLRALQSAFVCICLHGCHVT